MLTVIEQHKTVHKPNCNFAEMVPNCQHKLFQKGYPNAQEKENLLRVKCFTVQMKSEITQRHLFLGARSQHLGGGW